MTIIIELICQFRRYKNWLIEQWHGDFHEYLLSTSAELKQWDTPTLQLQMLSLNADTQGSTLHLIENAGSAGIAVENYKRNNTKKEKNELELQKL